MRKLVAVSEIVSKEVLLLLLLLLLLHVPCALLSHSLDLTQELLVQGGDAAGLVATVLEPSY